MKELICEICKKPIISGRTRRGRKYCTTDCLRVARLRRNKLTRAAKTEKDTPFYRAVAEGLCGYCRSRPHLDGLKACQPCRESTAASNLRLRAERKAKVLAAYGGKCQCCDEDREEFLTVDHIANDGNQHRREVNPASFYGWLIRNGFPKDNFQLLCRNCNYAKSAYGECPHVRERTCERPLP